ncbi:MAG: DUF86 domain-containing protein [Candidatus Lokiarchaeota archaeon]|nr:DUF86 domain-containing protein [Candidatus Lokiarchaeota archaeon]
MDVDKTWILEKFTSAKPFLAVLAELMAQDERDFSKDIKSRLQAERVFEILCQVILDVCSHVVARSEKAPPSTYSDCVRLLADLGVISEERLSDLIPLIRMRNLIVHQYGIIDPGKVHASLQELSRDIARFREDVLSWLDRLAT